MGLSKALKDKITKLKTLNFNILTIKAILTIGNCGKESWQFIKEILETEISEKMVRIKKS